MLCSQCDINILPLMGIRETKNDDEFIISDFMNSGIQKKVINGMGKDIKVLC